MCVGHTQAAGPSALYTLCRPQAPQTATMLMQPLQHGVQEYVAQAAAQKQFAAQVVCPPGPPA